VPVFQEYIILGKELDASDSKQGIGVYISRYIILGKELDAHLLGSGCFRVCAMTHVCGLCAPWLVYVLGMQLVGAPVANESCHTYERIMAHI